MSESAAGVAQRPYAPPADAIELVMVRHGASAPAVPGVRFDLVDGRGDPPLAPEGEEQARQVAAHLAGGAVVPSAVFHTALQRTVSTAAPLAATLGLEPVAVPALREVGLGDWDGGEFRIRAAARDPLVVRMIEQEDWSVIPGAETMEQIAERVRAGLDEVLAAAAPGTRVVAVLHGGIIGEVCHQVTGSRPFAFLGADNGSISRVVVLADGRRLLRSFNETGHLHG